MKKPSQAAREPTGLDASGSEDILGPNSEIGRKLRAYYDELVTEDIPDRFSQLLRDLETAEATEKTTKDGGTGSSKTG